MKCEACGLEKDQGGTYIVRYGNLSRTASSMSGKVVTKLYHIDGVEHVFICDACLDRRVDRLVLFTVVGFILLALILGVVGLIARLSVTDILLTWAFVVLLGIFIHFVVRRDWKKGKNRLMWGDQYAIQLKKYALKRQGYKKFFPREE